MKKLAFTTNDYDEEKTVGNTVKIWKCTTLNCDEKINITQKSNLDAFKVVVEHLNQHVRQETKVTCPVGLCGMSYLKYKSFNMHYNRHKYRQELSLKESVENTSISDQPSENLIQQEFEYDAPLSAPHNEIQTPSLNTSTNTKILERNICSYVPE